MTKTLVFLAFLLLLSISSLVNSVTLSSDVLALASFKSSINSSSVSSWTCLASWNFSVDPCSTPRGSYFVCGITCNLDSTRITAIVLDPAGYVGSLSPFIANLTELIHLDLSQNSFYGEIPSSISSLKNLQTLNLNSNSFSGSIPLSISNMKLLQSLDISHNCITGSIPQTLNNMENLRRLDLSFNDINGSLPKLPPNLIELAIKANSLSGHLQESSFRDLNELEVVELSVNHLRGVLGGWFFQLPSIQQINLSNNSLSCVQVYNSTEFDSQLVAVDLGFNRIEGYLPVNFSTFSSLSALTLRYNRFRGFIPREYSKKPSLKRLFLDGNFLIGKVPFSFRVSASAISGSIGDNCLQDCPTSLEICSPSQKPFSVCKQAYRRKPW